MKRTNCVVADDEGLARETIEHYVSKFEHLHLIASCKNGRDLVRVLENEAVDLLFLDIEMPGKSGIELLRSEKALPPAIITTAYPEFAIESYEFNVIDYLLKPISLKRFDKAIEKYNHWRYPETPDVLHPATSNTPDFIDVRFNKRNIRIPIAEISHIEGLKDYVKIHTSDREIITYQTLGHFEKELATRHFLRIHRSFIVSMNHIKSYCTKKIEITCKALPIGRNYTQAVLKRMAGL